jgi:hypothetical protein
MLSPETITDIVLNRRQVYDLETDSKIRELSNRLSAKAFLEILLGADDQDPKFPEMLSTLMRELPSGEIGTYSLYLREGNNEEPTQPVASEGVAPVEYYLRLIFTNEDAAYYQFPLFPNLGAPYVQGAARKRAGAVQHLRLDLSGADALQQFIEECRTNPHFVRVEQSTAEEFMRAPSNSV